MNNKTVTALLFVLASVTMSAQELKTAEATFEDYKILLDAQGYKVYSFDTKDFSNKSFMPIVKEYIDGKEIQNSDNDWNSAFTLGERLVVGFMPTDNDTTIMYTFYSDWGGSIRGQLKLRPVVAPIYPRPIYRYRSIPFELPKTDNKFIPLVLHCSFWYDNAGRVRCCGEKTINPSFSAEILKYTPHYYILGIEIK